MRWLVPSGAAIIAEWSHSFVAHSWYAQLPFWAFLHRR
jgi:hypothetical protein